ncbi:MAG: OmpA family protein [Deltaproteobacteria bacterium]|nr:OmpA family protein [Deltaproteobacteria bacterium]
MGVLRSRLSRDVKRKRKRVFFIVIAWILAFIPAEIAARVFSLDIRVARPMLAYQNADVASHQAADDPDILFRLKPGVSKNNNYTVNVNALGFRGPERSAEKPAGVFRILCYGGSNVYGLGLNDDETWPAQLEQHLNEAFNGTFEVWNGGACAYVPVQMAALAREGIERFDPDLVLFGLSNGGARTFLTGAPVKPYFRKYPRMWNEFFPPECLSQPFILPYGGRLLLARASAVVRAVTLSTNRERWNCAWHTIEGHEKRNLKATRELFEGAAGEVPVALFLNPDCQRRPGDYDHYLKKRAGAENYPLRERQTGTLLGYPPGRGRDALVRPRNRRRPCGKGPPYGDLAHASGRNACPIVKDPYDRCTVHPANLGESEVRMRNLHVALLLIAFLASAVLVSGCGGKEYPAELLEAKAALADSKAEGADEVCPDEYASAEEMMMKAEALYAEEAEEEMNAAATETISLADSAKECAIAKKEAAANAPQLSLSELPDELAGFKETAYFAYNDNGLNIGGASVLQNAASFIKQHQGQYKFWVLITAHADRPGHTKVNYDLSRRRGVVARYYLIDQGVEADRIIIKPVGEYEASLAEKKEVKNKDWRKVEVTLIPYNALDTIKVGSP